MFRWKDPTAWNLFKLKLKPKSGEKVQWSSVSFIGFFKSLFNFTKRLKIKREREKRERGESVKVAQGDSGFGKAALDSQICPSLKQLLDAESSSWKQLFSCFTNNLDSKDSPDLVRWQMSTMLATSLRDQKWRDDFSQSHPCAFSFLMNVSPLWLLNLWSFGGSGTISFSLGGSDCSSVMEKIRPCISSLLYWLHVKLFLFIWLGFGFFV